MSNLTTAIDKLHSKIQFLFDKGYISEKQVDSYNEILLLMDKSENEHNYIVENMAFEHFFAINELNSKNNILQKKCLALESICYQHGIINLHLLLQKQNNFQQAVEMAKNGEYTLPYVFTQKDNFRKISELYKYLINK